MPLALLIEGAVVVARDGGRRDECHRTFAERLCERRERNHAGLLARRPGLHHLARCEVQKTIRVDVHHAPFEVYDKSTGKKAESIEALVMPNASSLSQWSCELCKNGFQTIRLKTRTESVRVMTFCHSVLPARLFVPVIDGP